MSKADAVAAVLWLGATLYAVFGGADFGAGLWDLLARGRNARRARAQVDRSIGPVWEANHVWLIFCLVVLWTGFPDAFAAIVSTLYVPLALAALGIVLRGSGFAFRKAIEGDPWRRRATLAFSVSSVLTPFFMGAVIGAIAAGEVPADGNGEPFSSWLAPFPLVVGALFVATGGYLAAVFLVIDSRRAGDADLEDHFARCAVAAAVVAGAAALAGILVAREEARPIYDGLTGEGLPLVIVSGLCGLAVLGLLWRGARTGLRPLAVAAVAAVIWAWGAAQYPDLLPGELTIEAGAAVGAALTSVLVVFGVAAVLVLPALGLLYALSQRDVLD